MPLYLQSIQIPQTGNSFTPPSLPCRKKRHQGCHLISRNYDTFCKKTTFGNGSRNTTPNNLCLLITWAMWSLSGWGILYQNHFGQQLHGKALQSKPKKRKSCFAAHPVTVYLGVEIIFDLNTRLVGEGSEKLSLQCFLLQGKYTQLF